MRWGVATTLGLTLATCNLACQDTEECIQLRKVLKATERALTIAKARAALAAKTKKTLKRTQAATERKLSQHGLDLSEEALFDVLKKRAEGLRGVRLEKTSRAVEQGVRASPLGTTASETVYSFELPSRSLSDAWRLSQSLIVSPPLTRVFALIAPKKRGERYRLELGRAEVLRLPMEIEPKPLPARPSAADVPSELGMCGASELRERIAAAEEELEKHAAKARETTVHLPLEASWKGLSRRADRVVAIEQASREIADALVDAVEKSRTRFLGVAIDEEVVVLEVAGGKWERGRIQRFLPEPILQSLKDLEVGREGVARMAVVNRVAESARFPSLDLEGSDSGRGSADGSSGGRGNGENEQGHGNGPQNAGAAQD